MEYKIKLDLHLKRIQTYTNNLTKAYAFIWEQCSLGMQNKIESRSDYNSSIKNDPIALLKAIKQHALNYQEHKYPMAIIFDAIKTLITLKQKEGESLREYTKRFKVSRDILISHIGGPLILKKPSYLMSWSRLLH